MGGPERQISDDFWREFLTHGSEQEARLRNVLRRIPTGPRCRMCLAPFRGVGAPLMRAIGRRRSNANPTMCSSCFDFLVTHHGGAEIEITMVFADIRGSTSLAESMTSASFHQLLNRFYDTASTVVFEHDGTVDKFVGDELVAFFFPLLTGERHAARAVDAACALLRASGHSEQRDPRVPVGAGVHTGVAFVGAVGEGDRVELTAVGDAVNVAARLASQARAGEVVVSVAAAEAAGLDPTLERRVLYLKGRVKPTEVVRLDVAHGDCT